MNLFNRSSFVMLEQSMNTAALRHNVISNNIANAEVPNFKRSKVVFEELLQKEMQGKYIPMIRSHYKHMPIDRHDVRPSPEVVEDQTNRTMNQNGNNVDLDTEMAMLAQNQLHHQLLVQQLSHEFQMLRTSIGGSGS